MKLLKRKEQQRKETEQTEKERLKLKLNKIVQDLREKIDKEIDEAFNFAEQSPFPDYNYHKLNFHSK